MASYGDVRRWLPGPLDGAEQQLKARADTLPWLADELDRASKPTGWHGLAADAAAVKRVQLADGIEHIVAGVAAARTALMAASDGVTGLNNLVAEADGLAQAYGLSISDAGEVVDPGLPPNVPAEQTDAMRQEREKIKKELLDRVQQILTRAEEIDNSLADVLGKIGHGEIHDGGATSLAAAAEAGAAQGVMTPQIPGPPPNPPTDPGAGEHGSDPWYTRGDDLFIKELAGTAATFADRIGWTHASAHLRHYLGNSGDDLEVSPDEMMRDVDRFRGEVDKTTAAEMRRIAAEAEANGTYGKPVQFSSGWKGDYIGPEDSKDWYYAMGGVQYSVTGVATVHPPEQPGGEPRIEMDYKTHVFDRYNWDGGKETEIGPVTITDDSMAEMHRAGVAQEFNVSGSTDAKQYAGTVPPPGQRPELPAPPDNRDGTRTDHRPIVQKPTSHILPHDARSPFGRHPLRRMIIAVMLTLGVTATTTACGTEPSQEDRMRQSGSTGATTDQAVIDEALRFGGITLPPSARVLGAQYDKGIDQRYRLAIGIDPNSVETLLSGSGFTTPLEPDPGPFMAPIDGFDLTTATTVSSTSDTLAPQGERSSTVFRRIAVDRSNPTEPVVHVWLFTT